MFIRVLDFMEDDISEVPEEELFADLVDEDDTKTGESYLEKLGRCNQSSIRPNISEIDTSVFGFFKKDGEKTPIIRTQEGDGYIIDGGDDYECYISRDYTNWAPYGEKSLGKGKLFYAYDYWEREFPSEEDFEEDEDGAPSWADDY